MTDYCEHQWRDETEIERLESLALNWKSEAQGLRAEIERLEEQILAFMQPRRSAQFFPEETERLRRKVEYLSRDRCLGCLDAVCDNCGGKKR
jgi:hypothetical protein